jgi:hypothetical protein
MLKIALDRIRTARYSSMKPMTTELATLIKIDDSYYMIMRNKEGLIANTSLVNIHIGNPNINLLLIRERLL